jgi:hypothetical protein
MNDAEAARRRLEYKANQAYLAALGAEGDEWGPASAAAAAELRRVRAIGTFRLACNFVRKELYESWVAIDAYAQTRSGFRAIADEELQLLAGGSPEVRALHDPEGAGTTLLVHEKLGFVIMEYIAVIRKERRRAPVARAIGMFYLG